VDREAWIPKGNKSKPPTPQKTTGLEKNAPTRLTVPNMETNPAVPATVAGVMTVAQHGFFPAKRLLPLPFYQSASTQQDAARLLLASDRIVRHSHTSNATPRKIPRCDSTPAPHGVSSASSRPPGPARAKNDTSNLLLWGICRVTRLWKEEKINPRRILLPHFIGGREAAAHHGGGGPATPMAELRGPPGRGVVRLMRLLNLRRTVGTPAR